MDAIILTNSTIWLWSNNSGELENGFKAQRRKASKTLATLLLWGGVWGACIMDENPRIHVPTCPRKKHQEKFHNGWKFKEVCFISLRKSIWESFIMDEKSQKVCPTSHPKEVKIWEVDESILPNHLMMRNFANLIHVQISKKKKKKRLFNSE